VLHQAACPSGGGKSCTPRRGSCSGPARRYRGKTRRRAWAWLTAQPIDATSTRTYEEPDQARDHWGRMSPNCFGLLHSVRQCRASTLCDRLALPPLTPLACRCVPLTCTSIGRASVGASICLPASRRSCGRNCRESAAAFTARHARRNSNSSPAWGSRALGPGCPGAV